MNVRNVSQSPHAGMVSLLNEYGIYITTVIIPSQFRQFYSFDQRFFWYVSVEEMLNNVFSSVFKSSQKIYIIIIPRVYAVLQSHRSLPPFAIWTYKYVIHKIIRISSITVIKRYEPQLDGVMKLSRRWWTVYSV